MKFDAQGRLVAPAGGSSLPMNEPDIDDDEEEEGDMAAE
jgi:hypothetical protein